MWQSVPIVPAVQSLRSVQAVIWRTADQGAMFNVNVESVKAELGNKALHRGVEHHDVAYVLREKSEAYNGDFGSKSQR